MIPSAFAQETNPLKVMNWSIWHGGREDGKEIGPQRVIEVIKESLLGICFWRKVREERIWAEYIGEKGGWFRCGLLISKGRLQTQVQAGS